VLEDFLDAKPLFYDEIDYSRMPRIYQRVQKYFKLPKVIHLIGTNGKGTTGRFLASALHSLGYQTGHYTSPHIIEFNERIWFNGKNVSMEILEDTHQRLLSILTPQEAEALSYFEYTTFLAMLFFTKESDFIILEAGLGGEYDATAVFDNDLTLVTPIDKDHEAFLGTTVDKIAKTKLNAVQKAAIIAKQKHAEVYDALVKIQEEKKFKSFFVEDLIDEYDRKNIQTIAKRESLAIYLQENLSLAIATLNYFHIPYKSQDFFNARLFGRLSAINKHILVDVGHNTLAAQAIVTALTEKKYILVYNSYKDKNYKEILKILKPIIYEVQIITIDNNSRIARNNFLEETLSELDITYSYFSNIKKDENYLVFGSFSVVEAFLKVYRG